MPLKTVNAWKNLPAEERGAAVAPATRWRFTC